MKVEFQGSSYKTIFTGHAKLQMEMRGLTEAQVVEVIETGEVKPKASLGKFWVFKKLSDRKDNLISISISLEKPHLIVITAMVNWSPK